MFSMCLLAPHTPSAKYCLLRAPFTALKDFLLTYIQVFITDQYSNALRYWNNPEILQKLGKAMGGMGGGFPGGFAPGAGGFPMFPGGAGGFPGGAGAYPGGFPEGYAEEGEEEEGEGEVEDGEEGEEPPLHAAASSGNDEVSNMGLAAKEIGLWCGTAAKGNEMTSRGVNKVVCL